MNNQLYAIVPAYLQDADLIIEKPGGCTYVCKLSPRANRGEDLTTQAVWQIKRIREFQNGTDNCTEIMFPNGNQGYMYRLDELEMYNYDYKR